MLQALRCGLASETILADRLSRMVDAEMCHLVSVGRPATAEGLVAASRLLGLLVRLAPAAVADGALRRLLEQLLFLVAEDVSSHRT